MRMPFRAEFRWYIASILLRWVFTLTHREASHDMIWAYQKLGELFEPDPRFNTVKMRRARS